MGIKRKIANTIIALSRRSIFANWVIPTFVYNFRFLRILPNRFYDRSQDYLAESHNLKQAKSLRFNDLEANFFIRAIIEHGYDHVIELGAYHLERAAGIARLFPSVKVYGLDITTDFRCRRIVDGVEIGPNTLDYISEISARHKRGLICCRGTMVYYRERDLLELFELALRLGADIALSEPNSPITPYLRKSQIRTFQTWYHSFPQMLKKAGFTLPDNEGAQIQCSISEYGEERTFIFARAKGYPET